MCKGKMRRAQVISPFGVGAMSVLVDGTCVITAGLDCWFRDNGNGLSLEEYEVHDWRLESRLRVSGFRLPPDYREKRTYAVESNLELTIPVLRFPRWCFCMYCKRLEQASLTMKQNLCCCDKSHESLKYKPRMSQVPFVTICAAGHVDDFPFNEWVHRSKQPTCKGVLRLKSVGGGGLEGQRVVCDRCHMERSLQGITEGSFVEGEEHTVLTDRLVAGDDRYVCTGARPWLGELRGACELPMRGALRGAGNVYFPKVESSLYLPSKNERQQELIHDASFSAAMRIIYHFCGQDPKASDLRSHLNEIISERQLNELLDDDLLACYRILNNIVLDEFEEGESDTDLLTEQDEWRYPEFQYIRETPDNDRLTATDPGIHTDLRPYLERVRSVDALTETRVLRGFTRVRDEGLGLNVGKALLRREHPCPPQDWLPAYVVKGEGIYLELDHSRLAKWEKNPNVGKRASKLDKRYKSAILKRDGGGGLLTSRFILLHTLSHLLITELIFSCGYSSASLRERLYVSSDCGRAMGGLLLYTAAGDSEGTLGGLVRMAKQDNLRSVFISAISNARWCSTDPVCMDAGEKGQGPDSCNLAACHGCALLPETSCEEFNRFLDRGLVIGTFDDPSMGYFSDFI